jgi:hypothetical protein
MLGENIDWHIHGLRTNNNARTRRDTQNGCYYADFFRCRYPSRLADDVRTEQ